MRVKAGWWGAVTVHRGVWIRIRTAELMELRGSSSFKSLPRNRSGAGAGREEDGASYMATTPQPSPNKAIMMNNEQMKERVLLSRMSHSELGGYDLPYSQLGIHWQVWSRPVITPPNSANEWQLPHHCTSLLSHLSSFEPIYGASVQSQSR